ncbi:hypothetical protein KAR10_00255 [bacterium]|nr:hypothetical protein [bacterium]
MINPSFTRGEYWLLEAVSELALPICRLNWENIEEALNKTGHNMSRPLLVETMQKLFSEGLIVARRFDHWNDCFVFTAEQIETALDERQDKKEHYYCLTTKGGEHWEAFAFPEWNYYIDVGYELSEDDDLWIGELICSNKDHLKTYFHSLSYYKYDVVGKSIQWDILEPWKATYWKELPIGHRIRFHCRKKEHNSDPHVPSQIDQLWYDKLWYQWR